ncbi:pentapeptide repeat-containing protein [Geodermatophilus marinus]|uniref:pentapeptide repeat-containing protein n=1 Tax=Geodermatophilus sp. LHW52908 TaxID=2303986 RepID=UPI000E3B8AFE|nr:pentapeptide repeat-containing protein [Geodermatophilus sp. LHW52908]RFU23456.1 pentapeptide repeat-containing protein [Geodermatophilus sp. LHW52908]
MHSSRPHVRPPEAGAVVEGQDLARVDWWGTELEAVTFTRCRFEDAGLEELVTRRCVFDSCVLTGVRLGGSRHTGSAFLSCRFDRARLFDAVWTGCKLTGSQFPGAVLRPVTSVDCDWSWTSLRGVDLSGSDLSGQRFREADLTGADLRECDLTGADLDHSRLQGAALRGADLRGASTDAVPWRALDLTGVRLDLQQSVQVARAHGALVTD